LYKVNKTEQQNIAMKGMKKAIQDTELSNQLNDITILTGY